MTMVSPTAYYCMVSPYPWLYADMPGFSRACTASSTDDCWLCDVLTTWNSALCHCRLSLREEEPGKLCLESLRTTNIAVDCAPCDCAAFFLAYLPRQHKCIRRISLHRNLIPRQRAAVKPLLGADWWPAQPECNVQYIEIFGIGSHDWDILLCGLGRVSALKSLLIEDVVIDDCFVSKLDPLLAASPASLQKLAISASPTEDGGVSERLISSISKCSLLTELSINGHLTTTGVQDLRTVLLSCKGIRKLSLGDQFNDERTRALLGALSSCVRTNASLTELHYETLSLDFIELLEAMQFNCTLKHLVLSGCKHNRKTFGKEHGVALRKALSRNSDLQSLVISHCSLSELAVDDISTGLACNSSLEHFDLSHSRVNFYAASTLCRALCINRTLNMLVLDPDGGDIDERIRLSEQLAVANCYRRVIVPWGRTDMPNIANVLTQPALCPPECQLHTSGFSSTSFSQVCSALSSSIVESLSVTFVDSDLNLARQMCKAIQENRSIVRLSLQEDSISSGTCFIVANALLVNKTVTKLSLSINSMSTSMALTLSEILSKNQTLEELLLNCIDVKPWRVDVIADGLKQNHTLTCFSIFDERACANCSTVAVIEHTNWNLSNWNCAVQFVLEPSVSKRRAVAFESLQRMPCFLQRVAAVFGKSRAEALVMVEAAKHFIRNYYLFITGVVCQDVCCYPSGQTQLDQLNSDCLFAITRYLSVSDVIRD